MSNRKEFWALDWVRFSLAVYLVIYHTWHGYDVFAGHAGVYSFLGLGNMATSIFFVLSGFLLTYVYASGRQEKPIDKRAFWIARFSTLYPLHIFGLLLTLPSVFLVILKQGGIEVPMVPGGESTRILGSGEAFFAVMSHLTLTHAWNPLYLIFDIPSWSLSALFFFYLFFPYLAPKLLKLKHPLLALVGLGVLFMLPGLIAEFYDFKGLVADGVLHRNPIVRMPLFIGGIVLCVVYKNYESKVEMWQKETTLKLSLLTTVIATLFTGAYFYAPGSEHIFPLVRTGLYFPAALAVVWLASCASDKTSDWNRTWSARLGKASLSIFMLHLPLFALLVKAERFLRACLESGNIHDLDLLMAYARTLTPLSELYIVHLILIVWLAVMFQNHIVTPVQVVLRKKLMSRRIPSPVIQIELDEGVTQVRLQ